MHLTRPCHIINPPLIFFLSPSSCPLFFLLFLCFAIFSHCSTSMTSISIFAHTISHLSCPFLIIIISCYRHHRHFLIFDYLSFYFFRVCRFLTLSSTVFVLFCPCFDTLVLYITLVILLYILYLYSACCITLRCCATVHIVSYGFYGFRWIFSCL